MATSRKLPTAYLNYTYGSGKTFTSLSTWEELTDVNLASVTTTDAESSGNTLYVAATTLFDDCELDGTSTVMCDGQLLTITGVTSGVSLTVSETISPNIAASTAVSCGAVLTCATGTYDDVVDMDGATTSSSYFRIIRGAVGTASPTTGARFEVSSSIAHVTIFDIGENYSCVYDIAGSANCTFNNGYARPFFTWSGSDNVFVGCYAYDCESTTGTAYCAGIYLGGANSMAVNCIAENIQGDANSTGGFFCTSSSGTQSKYVYNCTIKDSDVGVVSFAIATRTTHTYVKNTISQDNAEDLITYNAGSSFPYLHETTNATSGVLFDDDGVHLSVARDTALGLGTDLSADGTFAFNDDFDGETIVSDWCIGADFALYAPSNFLEMFVDEEYVESKSGVTFEVNRPTKYSGNPIYGLNDLSAAIADDGGSMTDETTGSAEDTANDITLLPAAPVVDDAYYFGSGDTFNDLALMFGTVGAGTWTITWEYWDGSAWSALANVSSNVSANAIHFRPTSVRRHDIAFDLPSDWATATVNSQGPYYYIRARVSAFTSITTQPKGTQAWTADASNQDIIYISTYKVIDEIKLFHTAVVDNKSLIYGTHVLESTDGETFTKASSNSVSYRNSTDNNLLMDVPECMGGVFYNPDTTDASKTFVGVITNTDDGAGGQDSANIIVKSSDGLTWTEVKDFSGDANHLGMSITKRADGRWIDYYQYDYVSQRRSIAAWLSDTTDLTGTWTDLGVLIESTSQDVQHYYPGIVKLDNENYFLFDSLYNKTTEELYAIEVYYSRNGTDWTSLDSAWISKGSSGTWDDEILWGGANLVTIGNEWFYYYSGHKNDHAYTYPRTGQIGLAKIGHRRIGNIKGDGGVATTNLFTFSGKVLSVNCDTTVSGDNLQVELLDGNDSVVTGYAKTDCVVLSGEDLYSKNVSWGEAQLPDGDYKLKFYLTGTAKLYSYFIGETQNYSKAAVDDLPADTTDLTTAYTDQNYTDTSADNATRVAQAATAQYAIHQFKNFAGNNSAVTVSWNGQSNVAPSTATVYLQVFNWTDGLWETLDSDGATAVDTDFTLSAPLSDLTEYKDENNTIVYRVYQFGTVSLSTDLWSTEFTDAGWEIGGIEISGIGGIEISGIGGLEE